ncbi:ubiquitin carboxyl-terminal hydrolase 26-like [Actinidia eriantha]|uniref:ubiquitin carboxyl-terminal hydrolase 26-like n=1 Tax=Actinidia eriantha TaxID=165200 RepID=UPI00258F7483|nr:ubiquitin carboxyl-terminal hydrolase 26-like [Actinidia eriantha]XP_057511126.1 ubiquitin carboxyl-terminal hydrolase 26-like [Actinidia eriantha]XP_057511127.1 ubiquitin carboxyl-terminal hydrolase 26-like [Actinidia eriantha]XP_057511128.1 ubiquitin carboxyl-terminal hydrolase 26-like [Actinidia eriantha]
MSSRPTTRNKNKRQRPDDNVQATSEIFRKILSTGQVTEDDVNKLYMIWKPICQGCRVNTKDNPNCFCGLVPPPTGSRKSGLWQKMSEILLSLGPDPSQDLRASTNSPAGLTNLGATCYANSILQCLYMIKSFREGVFSVEPDVLKEQPVLYQLARLFAQLHASKKAFVDSAPFIKTLELDNAVQQDSHEFLTLLFSLLERCLRCSKVSKARTIVQDLFRGSVSHVTTCLKCGKDSEASFKIEDFYELELNVKGLKSLYASLDDYLSVEELQGDNQYYCESCATRVDATRSIKLRSLPAVLNFQLKRYVFLPKTTTKKKITSAFCFPGELDMGHRLPEYSQSKLIYDLAAVLIHKGSAVNSGHYIAHIKDENTGQWWEFDDEDVSTLGQHPFGEDCSVTAKSVQTEPVIHPSCSEPMNTVAIGNHTGASQPKSSDSDDSVHTFSSSDAYMLMYILRNSNNVGQKGQMDSGGIKMENSDVAQQNGVSLPSHLCEEIEQLNSSYVNDCENYKSKKEIEFNCITEQRQEVRSVLSQAPVQSLGEPYFWISTDWLRHWAENISPLIIDNNPIRCLHGKVPVSKIVNIKRLSAKAWTFLFSKYNGGPTLAKDDYCVDCLFEVAHGMVSADSYRDRRTSMKELADAALAGNCLDGPLYYVSKTWLQHWIRRKNIDSPCEADAEPTASIRCPHGDLKPEQATGAKRVPVPESLWLFFYDTANELKPDDPLDYSTFPSDSVPCAQCNMELTEVASSEDIRREFKLKQRQNHERLALGKSIALFPLQRYYLLPTPWLSKWKTYITAGGKSASSSVEPETLNIIIDLLKCEKHSRLLERPPGLTYKRSTILQKSPNTDRLTIITENDWKLFCEDWSGTEERGISAEIEVSSCMEDDTVGVSAEMPISEEHMNTHDEINGETESKQFVVKTRPEVCEDCIGERESCELMTKLNYCNEDICVCFVRGKEPPRSILEASGNILEPDRRTSKRSRKTSFGNSINLKVSGSTSIYQLKMMIWESFGVVKENQILHKGSRVIDGESTTLADMNIFPGDILWVTDSEIHENRDIADELSDHKMDVQQAEEGFRGTLLTSNISSQVV